MTRKQLLIVVLALLIAALVGTAIGTASADGPWLWQEKCPVRHYEVRVEQVERNTVLVSCVRMAEEAAP